MGCEHQSLKGSLRRFSFSVALLCVHHPRGLCRTSYIPASKAWHKEQGWSWSINYYFTSISEDEAEMRELWLTFLLAERVLLSVSKFRIKTKLKGKKKRIGRWREKKCLWLTRAIKISPGSFEIWLAFVSCLHRNSAEVHSRPTQVCLNTIQSCPGLKQINVEVHKLALASCGFGPSSLESSSDLWGPRERNCGGGSLEGRHQVHLLQARIRNPTILFSSKQVTEKSLKK